MAVGGVSACDLVIRELQLYFQEYRKGRQDVFGRTSSLIEIALENSERLKRDNKQSGADNPDTSVHTLVDYLRTLRRGPNVTG